MSLYEIIARIKATKKMSYREKVALIRELFKHSIEILSRNGIDVDDENPFELIKGLRENEEAKMVLKALELIKTQNNDKNEYD